MLYTLHCVKWHPVMRIIHLSGIHLGRFDRIKFTLLPAVAPLVGQVWSRDQTRPGTPVEPGKAFRCGKDLQGTRWRTSVCRLLQPSTKTRLVHKFPYSTFTQVTGRDHQGVLVSRGWKPSNAIWEHTTSHWTKQSTWPRTVLCGGWCLHMELCTPSGGCQKRRERSKHM